MNVKARSIGWLHNEDEGTVTLTIVPDGGTLPIRKKVSKRDFFAVKEDKKLLDSFIKAL